MADTPPTGPKKNPAPAPAAAKPAPKPAGAGADIVARASTEYRVKHYLMVLLFVGLGAWFAYDGWVAWPAENAKIEKLEKERKAANDAKNDKEFARLEAELAKLKKHSDDGSFWEGWSEIWLQRRLAVALPPVGLGVLIWTFYRSRGAYRLREDVLTVPGHPPVPLDAITAVDRRKWDKKGIAHLHYELPNGKAGILTLDDYIYQRDPTDAIYKRVEEVTGVAEDDAEK